MGWEIPARVRAGDSIPIVLVYRVLKPLDRSWKIFIHVDGPKFRVNGDHDPLGGRCPTSTWRAGDVIVDRSTARTYDTHDAGKYDVSIGFFGGWEPNWKNLALSDPPVSMRGEYENYKLTSIQIEK